MLDGSAGSQEAGSGGGATAAAGHSPGHITARRPHPRHLDGCCESGAGFGRHRGHRGHRGHGGHGGSAHHASADWLLLELLLLPQRLQLFPLALLFRLHYTTVDRDGLLALLLDHHKNQSVNRAVMTSSLEGANVAFKLPIE